MNRLLFPAFLALAVIGAAFMAVQPPPQPSTGPSASNDLEAAAPQLEHMIDGFLARVRGHNAPLPVTEVEARRVEAMLGAMNLEVPRGTITAGSTVSEISRAAMAHLTPAQLAQIPGLVQSAEGGRRALPTTLPHPGTDLEPRSAELRLNGIPLDAARARAVTIRTGDRLEAAGPVYYPVRIGNALVEFRDETRLVVKDDELTLDEGQILVRTQENAPSSSPSASPSPAPSPAPRASSAPVTPSPAASLAASPPPSTAGRYKVGTPHAEMIDIGTAFVATAETRRSRCEVLMGRVLMRSKRTGATLELEPGEFAWTEDDGTLAKRSATLLFSPAASPAPGASAPGASAGPGGGASPTPPTIADESTLIPSGDLPKVSPAPGFPAPTPIPTPTPSPTASPDATPSPTQSPPATTNAQDPQRIPPSLGGGIGGAITPTPTPTPTPTATLVPPVTPTPAPTDTQ